LVPIFFVLMGIQVRLETFASLSVLGVAAGLTIAAIVGKQICGFGVLEKGLDRLTVGVGMIPRGEVGLIFASIGKSLKVIDDATFSAVVIMVIVTTLITPPVLKVTSTRGEKRR
jgi:Kef-type K+ transport system membrane component KefB